MIRAFILYYLNIKKTHGYEIQKFLQVQGTDQWAKIQSGSIYYALTKLEKEKLIQVAQEERVGARIRKIYEITDLGRLELKKEMAKELASPIVPIGSAKFITDPMLSTLSKEECQTIIREHIQSLQEQKEFWEKWQAYKTTNDSMRLIELSFQMTIDSLNSQIVWHEELLSNLDYYIEISKGTKHIIQSFDFGILEGEDVQEEKDEKLSYVMKLKEAILEDPRNAIDNLDKIIEQITKKSHKKQ